MSEVVDVLRNGRKVAWKALIPAFERAIVLAEEAEYEADMAANTARCATEPAYPPLVLDLARAASGADGGPELSEGMRTPTTPSAFPGRSGRDYGA